MPVIVWNHRDSEQEYPNKALNYETSRMTKRFLMVDTVSGITEAGGSSAGSTPKYVRFADNVKLTVQLDPDTQEHIRRPLLQLRYVEKEVSVLEDQAAAATYPVTFFCDYYEETSAYWQFVQVLMILTVVLVVITIAVRLFYFVRQNPPSLLGSAFTKTFALRLLQVTADQFSVLMFSALVILNAYWFIMYKM